jgi:hypothetical protein
MSKGSSPMSISRRAVMGGLAGSGIAGMAMGSVVQGQVANSTQLRNIAHALHQLPSCPVPSEQLAHVPTLLSPMTHANTLPKQARGLGMDGQLLPPEATVGR